MKAPVRLSEQRSPRFAWVMVACLALGKFAIQFAAAGRYGIFRDELYYLACADHLAWGYVDHPPLIAWVAWFAAHAFGTSLYGLRLLPAVAGALLVVVTALLAQELGGGAQAQLLAGLAVIATPVYLTLQHWLTMNAFEPLLWMMALWLAARMIRRADPRYWAPIGAVCGLGIENKYTMLLLAAALVAGLLLTSERRLIRSGWFAAGVLLALLCFLPNLLWVVRHGFPFLEFERHSRMSGSRIARGPLAFLGDQALIMNPLLAPLWLGGMLWLAFAERRRWRALGVTALGVILALLLLRAKNYYAAPIYPVLFAAGAVALEQRTRKRAGWVVAAYAGAMVLSGALFAPFVLPVLPVQSFVAYQSLFHGFQPLRIESLGPDLLPQHFADEFGWEAMVRETARVYDALSEAERARTAIFANDYGEAAAIDFFGPRYGLPKAVSNHESYWLWGPRQYDGSTVIVLGSDGEGDREHFRSVMVAGRVDDPYARGEERYDIFLCRGLVTDLHTMWPAMKRW